MNEDDIDVGELLQILLSLQAEIGVVSDLLLDVLKTGEINKPEMIRAFHSLGQLSVDGLEVISNEAGELTGEDGEAQTGSTDNIH